VFLLLLVVIHMTMAADDPRYTACVKQCEKDLDLCKQMFKNQPKKAIECITCFDRCLQKCTKAHCLKKW